MARKKFSAVTQSGVGGARQAFLACFSAQHRNEVIEFGKRLSLVEADYFLFMARKAVCFYECLALLKLTQLRGALISDRCLDMNLTWLKGKRVAIIDDAVIFGSTLSTARDTLLAAGAVISHTIVFCVNTTSWRPKLTQPTEPFLRLSEMETTGFCADLVRAISVTPIPYAVDYPVVRRLKVADEDLPQFLSIPGWTTSSHTTPLQHSASVSVFVFKPAPSVLLDVFSETERNLQRVCGLFKVRVYGRRIEKHSATWFTVMPVVVFDPLRDAHIDELWNCLLDAASDPEKAELRTNFTTTTSKLRCLQFVLSARLARTWLQSLDTILGLRTTLKIDSDFAGFAFPPAVTLLIAAVAIRRLDFSAAKTLRSAKSNEAQIQNALDTYEPNPWSLQAALIQPFLELYEKKELPVRQTSFLVEDQPDSVWNRLKEGFSLPSLRRCVRAVSGSLAPLEVLSEFLDHAIDRGFVVPITERIGEVVFRSYRYGEDISDSEQFRRLSAVCAQSFLDAAGLDSMSRTWLEKLLVLLLQQLTDKNLVDPSDVAYGSSGTFGVRYALHGAVLKEGASKIYSHFDGQFYVDVLVKYGFFRKVETSDPRVPIEEPQQLPLPYTIAIQRERSRHYEPIDVNRNIPEASDAIKVSEGLGLLFGSLASSPLLKRQLNIDDFTILVSCHSPSTTAAALAAELEIFQLEWRYVEHKFKAANSRISAEEIRGKMLFTAINSARKKFSDYLNDATDLKLSQIQGELEGVSRSDVTSRYLLSDLKNFRSTRLLARKKHSESDRRYEFLLELGKVMYEINILVRLLLIGNNYYEGKTSLPSIGAELQDLVDEHASLLRLSQTNVRAEHSIRGTLVRAASRAQETDVDLHGLRDWALDQISVEVSHAQEQLRRVDYVVARVGVPNSYDLFPHVLILVVDDKKRLLQIERKICKEIETVVGEFNRRRSTGRAYTQTFKCDSTHPDFKGLEHCFAIGVRGDLSRALFMELAEKMSVLDRSIRRQFGFVEISRGEQPLKSDGGSSGLVALALWQRVASCLTHKSLEESGFYLVTANEDLLHFGELPKEASEANTLHVTLSSPNARRYKIDLNKTNGVVTQRNCRMNNKTSKRADIGLVCATQSELGAIRGAMKELSDYREEVPFKYYSASMEGRDCSHRVVMTYTTDQGNVSATNAVSQLLLKYRPKLLVLIGMGGGVHDDLKLYDVVFSTQVIYYEKHKEVGGESAVKNRAQALPISALMKRAIDSFLADRGAPTAQVSYASSGDSHTFNVLEGPIGSGEVIVGAKNSATRALVKSFNDKTLLVETEAWGAHSAVYDAAFEITRRCRHVVTIKGVADLADEDKDSTRQVLASRNAFEALRALLLTMSTTDLA